MFKNFLFLFLFFFTLKNLCFAYDLEVFSENFSWKISEEKEIFLEVKNFSEIAGFQIFLEYDKNFLEFKWISEN